MDASTQSAPGSDTTQPSPSVITFEDAAKQLSQASDNAVRQLNERERWDHVRRREDCVRSLLGQVGQRYRNVRLRNFEAPTDAHLAVALKINAYLASWPERKRAGEGIILFGPSGTGKDHLLIGLGLCVAYHHAVRVELCNGQTLFGAMRDLIDSNEREEDFIRRFAGPEVLILSDPQPLVGTSLTDFQASLLYRIVDARYNNLRPTWVSLNVANGAEAENRIGVAVVDRLRHGALCCNCNWPSYRKQGEL